MAAKFKRLRGTSAENRFDSRMAKLSAGCCCRSDFSRLAPRRDYTPIRYRCHWRWLSAKRKLDISPPLPLPLLDPAPPFPQSFLPRNFFPFTLGDPLPFITNLSTGLLFLKRRGIVSLSPTNRREYHFLRVVDRCPREGKREAGTRDIYFPYPRDSSSRSSVPLATSASSPARHLFMLDFSILNRASGSNNSHWHERNLSHISINHSFNSAPRVGSIEGRANHLIIYIYICNRRGI